MVYLDPSLTTAWNLKYSFHSFLTSQIFATSSITEPSFLKLAQGYASGDWSLSPLFKAKEDFLQLLKNVFARRQVWQVFKWSLTYSQIFFPAWSHMQPYFPGRLISLSHIVMYNPEESKAGDYISPVKCSRKVRFNTKLRGNRMTQKMYKNRAQPCWEGSSSSTDTPFISIQALYFSLLFDLRLGSTIMEHTFLGKCVIGRWIISFCMAFSLLWWLPRMLTFSIHQLKSSQRNWIALCFYDGKYIFPQSHPSNGWRAAVCCIYSPAVIYFNPGSVFWELLDSYKICT